MEKNLFMKLNRKKNLARTVVLSLLLSGISGACFMTDVLAGTDATTTVTTSGGSYNSIDVSNGNSTSVYGIKGSSGAPITVTLDGDKKITATSNGTTNSAIASVYGIAYATVTADTSVTPIVVTGNVDVQDGRHAGDVEVWGLNCSSTVNGDAEFNLTIKSVALGGKAFIRSTAVAYDGHNVVNGNAKIKVEATAGDATTSAGESDSNAQASGLDAAASGNGYGEVCGNANINVKAVAGKATTTSDYAAANASATASGSWGKISGSTVIDAQAIGGTASSNAGNARANAEAYGLCAGSPLYVVDINGNAKINVTAIGGTAISTNGTTSASATATGIIAFGSSCIIRGNASVFADATTTQEGQEFHAYSLFAFFGNNDLSSTNKTKILEGDVYASSYGTNNLVLDTADSYLQGNVVSRQYGTGSPFGVNNVSISNGAEWRPVYDNRYGTDCVVSTSADAATVNVKTNTVDTRSADALTLKDAGKVDLLWDGDRDTYRTLNIATLSGDGGIFNIATDLASETNGDKINITTGETGSTQYITVTDASLTTGATVTGPKQLLVATDASGSYTFVGKALDTGGLWETTPTIENLDGNNWYLTMVKAAPNPSTKDLIGTFESGYGLWRSTILDDTLHKRLGDVRYCNAEDGIWARVKAGKLSAATYDSSYQMYQVGMDKRSGNSIYGLAVDYSRISNDLTSGNGEGSNTGLSLYGTSYHDSGAYSDVVVRAGKLRTDMDSRGALTDSFDYDTWGYSAGYELGKTFHKDNGWFIEPQAQLVYGYLGGGDYTTDRGVHVNRDSINSFIGRLGFTLGRQINKNADYYFKANVYREFAGSGDMNLVYGSQKMNYDGDHKDTWFEMGIGTNAKLNNNTYFYGDVLKTFGADIQKKWQINAGLRWTWGGAK